MATDVVQATYDHLDQVAEQFGRSADNTDALLRRLGASTGRLADGGWKGEAADRFHTEMQTRVLPAVVRLSEALTTAQAVALQVKTTVSDAERRAAALFNSSVAAPADVGAAIFDSVSSSQRDDVAYDIASHASD